MLLVSAAMQLPPAGARDDGARDDGGLTARYLLERGTTKLEQGDRAGALLDFGKAINSDPAAHHAYWVRSQLYQRRNELPLAIKDLTAYLRLRPLDAVAHFERALCYQKLKLYDHAIADYRTAALPVADSLRVAGSKRKFRARAYLYRARLWEVQTQPRQAAVDYTEALRLDPAARGVYLRRGQAYAASGQYAAAVEDFRLAYNHNPNSYQLLTAWAWLLATCPDPDFRDGTEALRLIRRCRRRDVWCLDVTAAAHAELGEFDEALAILVPLSERFEPQALSQRQSAVLAHIELYRRGEPCRDEQKTAFRN